MKKKKKKQEPIFSALEEIIIEKTEKNFFGEKITSRGIKEPQEATMVLQPETIAIESPETPHLLLPDDGLPSEQEALPPQMFPAEEIVSPRVSKTAPAVIAGPSAETLTTQDGCLSDEPEQILTEGKEVHEPMVSCDAEKTVFLPPESSETPLVSTEIKEAEEKTVFVKSETADFESGKPLQPPPPATETFLSSEPESISPENNKTKEITSPSGLETEPFGTDLAPAAPLVNQAVFLITEPTTVSPEIEKTKAKTSPGESEAEPVATAKAHAETLSSPGAFLPVEQKIAASPSTPSLPEFSFVFIAPGTFIMGSPETEAGRSDDELSHEVNITHGFFVQTTPVTQRQWETVMGNNPSRFLTQGDDCPVESVSWYDCQKFIECLNSIGEHKYRLPTEAEWEYACRAGKCSSFSEGEISELFCDHDPNLYAAGWYCGNSSRTVHPVAQKKPNPWGLYDVHGNVLEWCQDWYGIYPAILQTDPSGPITGPGRVIRGGSWFSNAKSCRAAARFNWSPNSKSDFIGLRLVREQNL